MASIEGLLRCVYPPLSVGGGLSQMPIMKPPAHSWIPESNNQKILEVTSKITELLVGEVSGVGNSGAGCSFMEERGNGEKDHRLHTAMEDQPHLISQDLSRQRIPPQTCLHPLYAQGPTQKDQEIPQHHQVNDETIKNVKEEPEEPYARGDEHWMEEKISLELPMGSMREDDTPHHDQDENLVGFKQEEEALIMEAEQCKEQISLQISADLGHARDIQEKKSPNIVCSGGIQSESDITSNSPGVTTPHLHPLHTQKIISCAESGRCFTEKVSLKNHERIHTGIKPYSCSVCGRRFSMKTRLRSHKRVHTGEKPYSCSKCGKCFTKKSNVIRHEQVHTGEKPYSCSLCGRCFSQKAVLIRHKRVHTGEKPYSCAECGKCFSQNFSFIIHKRVHTGEKPYSCSECGKSFTNKSSLIRHKQGHAGKNQINVGNVLRNLRKSHISQIAGSIVTRSDRSRDL